MKLIKTLRPWGILSVLAVVMVLTAGVASATNKWNGYHWESNNLALTVVDNTNAPGVFDVVDAVAEWAGLGTDIQPEMALGSSGDVEVVAIRIRPHYLGLARIWVDEFGHIGKGRVELNSRYLNSLTFDEWDHVLCQELGHIWGLGHDNVEEGCMASSSFLGLPGYTSPSDHDKVTLNDIYNDHAEPTPDVTTEDPPPEDCDRNRAGKCKGSSGSNSINGRWVTIHEFLVP